jgi:hypothetical protein
MAGNHLAKPSEDSVILYILRRKCIDLNFANDVSLREAASLEALRPTLVGLHDACCHAICML